ncbi:DUF4199 domain-containing protein [Dokdonia donghaensis]|uniref:DUF4199 domain-containing protein n=1 Tax=Dokdonia donghaensis DSW-1 TaxID=1300343 RepID=A0A0A2GQD2_9FLAO|nr:DUF4199 domain-containing protein [Dokdonia donghaensis]ANH61313.1 hypothetical protein I597_2416 [Dokdonia donghaensis DSW-1]KGO05494.1 hypothetical protein NV36_00620 [Dokdonia donghaensis DSW-1]
MNDTIKSLAFKNGLFSGITIIILYVVAYVINVEILANFWFGLLIIIGLIILGFVTVAKAKSLQNGFISFKEAFSAYIVPVAIGLALPMIFLYLLFNFIDVEAAEMLKDISLEKTEEIMIRFGAPESEIEKAMEQAEAEDSYSLKNISLQYAFTVIFCAVIGLIAALSMKKKNQDLG